METIADKLNLAITSKKAIKQALIDKGVDATDVLSSYANDINDISVNFNLNTITIPYSTNAITYKYNSGNSSAAVNYSKYIGILAKDSSGNIKEWDTSDWCTKFAEVNYSISSMPTPIGFWMNYNKLHYWMLLPDGGNLYDISGSVSMTNSTGNYRMKHSMYSYTCFTSASSGSNTCMNITNTPASGTYNANNYTVTVSNNIVTLYSANTGRSFTFTKTDFTRYGFDIYYNHTNSEAILAEDMLIKNCEWLRDRHAICSGITTTEAAGTEIDVDILNSDGNQAAVGEDMYFWINGSNTGLLAKYNLCTNGSTGTTWAFTQTHSDAIYNSQIATGVNMNDTGVNSSTRPVKTPGSKGARAVSVNINGTNYWYITTPFITQPSSTFSNTVNVPDAPACYYMQYIREQYSDNDNLKNAHNALGLLLHLYYKNRTTLFTTLTTMLLNLGFSNITKWTNDTESCWLSFRYVSGTSWCMLSSGTFGGTSSYSLYVVVPVVACSN